jgi:uncharacterized membrane-anchored protein YjiN (DUF445 family)
MSRHSVVIKDLVCSECNKVTEKVFEEVAAVVCHLCCVKKGPQMVKQVIHEKENRKLKGWKFMKVYVDHEGNVYHKGEEQPKLKGTLPPTLEKPKKSRFKKEQEKTKKELKLAEKYHRKMDKIKQEEAKQVVEPV